MVIFVFCFLFTIGCTNQETKIINKTENISVFQEEPVEIPNNSENLTNAQRMPADFIVAGVKGVGRGIVDYRYSGGEDDAVIVLENFIPSYYGTYTFAQYIQPGHTGSITNLDGGYRVYITTGQDWNSTTRTFNKNSNYYKLVNSWDCTSTTSVSQEGSWIITRYYYHKYDLNLDDLNNSSVFMSIPKSQFIDLTKFKNAEEISMDTYEKRMNRLNQTP